MVSCLKMRAQAEPAGMSQFCHTGPTRFLVTCQCLGQRSTWSPIWDKVSAYNPNQAQQPHCLHLDKNLFTWSWHITLLQELGNTRWYTLGDIHYIIVSTIKRKIVSSQTLLLVHRFELSTISMMNLTKRKVIPHTIYQRKNKTQQLKCSGSYQQVWIFKNLIHKQSFLNPNKP